jgi:cyclin H
MSNYLTSTQLKHWTMSRQALAAKYEAKRLEYREKLMKFLPVAEQARIELYELRVEEEQSLIMSYSSRILRAGAHLHLSPKAQGAAVTYFKRYYLTRSLVEGEPAQMMFTALYLACKSQEVNISLTTLCTALRGSKAETILKSEVELISGVNYNLTVFLPYRAFSVLAQTLGITDPGQLALGKEFIDSAVVSELLFMCSPSVIASAAVFHLLKESPDCLASIVNSIDATSSALAETIVKVEAEILAARAELQTADSHFESYTHKMKSIQKQLRRLHRKANVPS